METKGARRTLYHMCSYKWRPPALSRCSDMEALDDPTPEPPTSSPLPMGGMRLTVGKREGVIWFNGGGAGKQMI